MVGLASQVGDCPWGAGRGGLVLSVRTASGTRVGSRLRGLELLTLSAMLPSVPTVVTFGDL